MRASLLAPVQTLIVAEQHRNASLDVYGASAEDPDFATLLVIIHREDVAVVATFDSRLRPLRDRRPAPSAAQ